MIAIATMQPHISHPQNKSRHVPEKKITINIDTIMARGNIFCLDTDINQEKVCGYFSFGVRWEYLPRQSAFY